MPRRGADRAGGPRPRRAGCRRPSSCTSGSGTSPTGWPGSSVTQRWLRARADRAPRHRVRPEVARAWELVAAQRRPLPRRGRRARGGAEPAAAARAHGGRARALAEGAVPALPLRRTWSPLLADGHDGLAEVAARTGYADQGHLTREFRADGRVQPDALAGRGAPKHPRRRATATGQSEHMSNREHPPPPSGPPSRPRDARAMIDFLVALGFEATAVYADDADPAVVHHCQLDWPEGGGVMFGSHKTEGFSVVPGHASFYVVTADPRAVHDRAVAAGCRDQPPAERHRLRLLRVRAPRPGGQPVVLRHLPGRAACTRRVERLHEASRTRTP